MEPTDPDRQLPATRPNAREHKRPIRERRRLTRRHRKTSLCPMPECSAAKPTAASDSPSELMVRIPATAPRVRGCRQLTQALATVQKCPARTLKAAAV